VSDKQRNIDQLWTAALRMSAETPGNVFAALNFGLSFRPPVSALPAVA
jgi:hypothetical protein